jgi:hypothetical protein
MALGVAGLGAIFFGLLGGHAARPASYVGPAGWTALATLGLLALSFAVAFWLPKRARELGVPHEVAAEPAPGAAAELVAGATGNA